MGNKGVSSAQITDHVFLKGLTLVLSSHRPCNFVFLGQNLKLILFFQCFGGLFPMLLSRIFNIFVKFFQVFCHFSAVFFFDIFAIFKCYKLNKTPQFHKSSELLIYFPYEERCREPSTLFIFWQFGWKKPTFFYIENLWIWVKVAPRTTGRLNSSVR